MSAPRRDLHRPQATCDANAVLKGGADRDVSVEAAWVSAVDARDAMNRLLFFPAPVPAALHAIRRCLRLLEHAEWALDRIDRGLR